MKQKKINPYPFYKTDNPLLTEHAKDLDIFLGKPFWIWDKEKHDIENLITNGKCCHLDILGRPQKNVLDFPIFDYERLIFDAIENNQNIWILKARGIGLTTFMIYYLTWKILSSSELDHESIFIISGTREAHANYIKEKMAKLFERNFPLLNIYTKYTELVLKNTWIKVFPTTAVKDLRGYFSAKYIFVDESDYFPESVQDELIHAITPYQTKSNCKIILSSTPFKPMGLMQRIEQDSNSKYFKLKLPYDYGINTIYSNEDLEKAKQSVSFEREFNLKYQGAWGNIFTPLQIEQCINLGLEFSTDKIPVSLYTLKSVGVDFGFSSSSTSIVTLEHIKTDKDIIRVVGCELIDKGDPNQIVNLCWDIWKKYGFMNCLYYCDGSMRALINLMKIKWDESLDWETSEELNPELVRIIPVNFNTNHKQMFGNLHAVISKNYLAIDPKFDKLLTSLRTAYANELTLDKNQTSYDDLLDGLRLSLKGYHIQ
jgi:hypothetical protein